VQHRVARAGGNAWLFRSQHAGDRFSEFVEWHADDAQPLVGRSDVAAALEALNASFPCEDSETWTEAKT